MGNDDGGGVARATGAFSVLIIIGPPMGGDSTEVEFFDLRTNFLKIDGDASQFCGMRGSGRIRRHRTIRVGSVGT